MSNLQKLIENAKSGLSVQEKKSLLTIGKQSLSNAAPLKLKRSNSVLPGYEPSWKRLRSGTEIPKMTYILRFPGSPNY